MNLFHQNVDTIHTRYKTAADSFAPCDACRSSLRCLQQKSNCVCVADHRALSPLMRKYGGKDAPFLAMGTNKTGELGEPGDLRGLKRHGMKSQEVFGVPIVRAAGQPSPIEKMNDAYRGG